MAGIVLSVVTLAGLVVLFIYLSYLYFKRGLKKEQNTTELTVMASPERKPERESPVPLSRRLSRAVSRMSVSSLTDFMLVDLEENRISSMVPRQSIVLEEQKKINRTR